jgi:hypothetical protein
MPQMAQADSAHAESGRPSLRFGAGALEVCLRGSKTGGAIRQPPDEVGLSPYQNWMVYRQSLLTNHQSLLPLWSIHECEDVSPFLIVTERMKITDLFQAARAIE